MKNRFLRDLVHVPLASIALCLWGCAPTKEKGSSKQIEEIAANEEVAAYMKSFEGRGDLADGSHLTPPKAALAGFRYPDDLKLELVLAEPAIYQPLDISFDHRGRLWVVQYNQYPYPEGVKVTGVDHHLRVTFDKIPAPPPLGVKGADKITFFEDTDGDGTYDKATNAIESLNIATGVALGRGKIWVLSPPLPAGLSRPQRGRSARWFAGSKFRGLRVGRHPCGGQQPTLGARRMAVRSAGKHHDGQRQFERHQKRQIHGAGHLAVPSRDAGF